MLVESIVLATAGTAISDAWCRYQLKKTTQREHQSWLAALEASQDLHRLVGDARRAMLDEARRTQQHDRGDASQNVVPSTSGSTLDRRWPR